MVWKLSMVVLHWGGGHGLNGFLCICVQASTRVHMCMHRNIFYTMFIRQFLFIYDHLYLHNKISNFFLFLCYLLVIIMYLISTYFIHIGNQWRENPTLDVCICYSPFSRTTEAVKDVAIFLSIHLKVLSVR